MGSFKLYDQKASAFSNRLLALLRSPRLPAVRVLTLGHFQTWHARKTQTSFQTTTI